MAFNKALSNSTLMAIKSAIDVLNTQLSFVTAKDLLPCEFQVADKEALEQAINEPNKFYLNNN